MNTRPCSQSPFAELVVEHWSVTSRIAEVELLGGRRIAGAARERVRLEAEGSIQGHPVTVAVVG